MDSCEVIKDLKIPYHVGIIMDGNGRWAKSRGLKRSLGHKEGAKTLKQLSNHIFNRGVKVLSIYAFSTENFNRDKEEVDYLMNLFIEVFKREFKFLMEKGIKVVFSGRREPLRKEVLDTMDKICKDTENNTEGLFNICLNYGSQYEILDMVKSISKKVKDGILDIEDIDLETINKNLYNDLPPLDFVIRTSGELRLSNFMLYQASYSEFYFPKIYFPDFKEKEFDEALLVFNKRDRRFGGINENKNY